MDSTSARTEPEQSQHQSIQRKLKKLTFSFPELPDSGDDQWTNISAKKGGRKRGREEERRREELHTLAAGLQEVSNKPDSSHCWD